MIYAMPMPMVGRITADHERMTHEPFLCFCLFGWFVLFAEYLCVRVSTVAPLRPVDPLPCPFPHVSVYVCGHVHGAGQRMECEGQRLVLMDGFICVLFFVNG